jgi:hypothetical protein
MVNFAASVAFHVAFMSREVAASDWEPLKQKGKSCNTRNMKMAATVAAILQIITYVQWFNLVAGEGLEPPTSGL